MKNNARKYRQKSALEHILLALVPYTRENFALTFKPHDFFNELERISGYNRQTIQSTYYRAHRQGYLQRTATVPRMTTKGERTILPFQAQQLDRDARLIIMFDIPEVHAKSRQALRRWLRQFEFTMVQQSVWVSDMDYRQAIIELLRELELQNYVELHESIKLYPKT